jgi:maltose O-acetyltransferase
MQAISEKEKMLSGLPYQPLDPELSAERNACKDALSRLHQILPSFAKERSLLLKQILPNAAKDIRIESNFQCDYGYNIYCGKRVYFNVNCVVLDVCKIEIGDHVLFGPNVHIYTATHPIDAEARRKQSIGKPVRIGSDCWIGGNAIILPGVTIGNGTIVAAGAIVTKNLPENVMAAGSPARIIKKLK